MEEQKPSPAERTGIKNTSTSSQTRFEILLKDLLRERNGLERQNILALVEEKKKKVGAGYLTDQGALFLVASDLGVTLKYDPSLTISNLSELQSDQRDISFTARILSLAPPRKFLRKGDSSPGFLAKIVVYDESACVPVSIWDQKVAAQIIPKLAPGDPITISGAYSRPGIDGSFNLNLTEKSEVSLAKEDNKTPLTIRPLKDRAVSVHEAVSSSAKTPLVVRGEIAGTARRTEFTRSKDGSQRHFVTFGMRDGQNIVRDPTSQYGEIRAVLWENSNPAFEQLKSGESVTLVNLRAKTSEFLGNKTVELHGDETTLVLEKWEATRAWLSQEFENIEKELAKNGQLQTLANSNVSKPTNQAVPLVARILSMGNQSNDETSGHALIIDYSKRKISLTALNGSVQELSSIQTDDVIVCRPDSLDLIGMRAVCSKSGSISKVKSERKDIPMSSSLETQIERFEAGTIVSVDVMTLSETQAREIQTKEGLVRRAEVTVGDPTGEIKLFAWRGLSKRVANIPTGARIWLKAVEVQSHEGKKFLLFKNYSRIEHIT